MVETRYTSTSFLKAEGAELTAREASSPPTTTSSTSSPSTAEKKLENSVDSTILCTSAAGMKSQTSDSQLRSRDQQRSNNRGQHNSSSSSRERGETTGRPTMAGKKEGISVALLSLPDDASEHERDEQGEGERRRRRRTARRNDLAFWLLGLINNSSYVIMMAVAKEIAPGAVGVVFLADVAPTMLVKISAPYWFHLVPYGVRVWACAVLMMLALVTVGYGGSTPVQLLGVCFSALQSGLGEASFLALSSFYDTPRALTAWSSGTGFAGMFGYAWVFFLKYLLGFSFRATLMMANLITLCWLYAYFRLLSDPNVSSSGGGGGVVGTSSSDQAHDGAYSPLPLQQFASSASLNGSEPRHTSGVGGEGEGEEGREEWGDSFGAPSSSSPDESLRVGGEDVAETRAAEMTVGQRLRFTLSLWRFTVPLMLVYFAEYTMQTGTWSAIGFPVTSSSARQKFYQYANWSYQGGVFISRSSGMVVRLSPLALWSLPAVQLAMLAFFYLVAVDRFWYDYSLLFLCFGVGLVGGLGYVNAFRLVAEAVRPELKELALASASVGDSLGVMFSDIFGTFVQACVYKRNGIDGAWATC